MAEGEEQIELKFRIFDGTDIGHRTYAPSTTVATLKQRLVAEWPLGYLFILNNFFLFLIPYFVLLSMEFECQFGP